MEVEYDLVASDAIAQLDAQYQFNPRIIRMQRVSRLLIGILAIVIVAISLVEWFSFQDPGFGIPMTIIGLLFLLYALTGFSARFSRLLMSPIMARSYNQGPNTFIGHHRLVVTPDSVTDITQAGETKVPWRAIYRVAENDKYAFLMMHVGITPQIPRRAFPTDEAFKQFVATAQQYKAAAG